MLLMEIYLHGQSLILISCKDAQGFGMAEAPRGGLGHWIKIKDGKVSNYQAVVPSTWECSSKRL